MKKWLPKKPSLLIGRIFKIVRFRRNVVFWDFKGLRFELLMLHQEKMASKQTEPSDWSKFQNCPNLMNFSIWEF